ncbi:MAG TPA: hypothetical protein VMS21_02595 [Methylomirabilota bacterium]|nr:hypothetical protein [Methylomirabilota bacterium]
MVRPLALIQYEKVLPGGQLVNRMQDLGYRVQTVSDASQLVEHARREKPLLVLVDLAPRTETVTLAISQLRNDPETRHVPLIAFVNDNAAHAMETARRAGATLVVTDAAIVAHLDHLLDQALHVE